MTEVKICGITNLEDAVLAAEAGADYIGFVFYPKSTRFISPSDAYDISRRLQDVKKVGLFVDEEISKVRQTARLVGLDALQFHGQESPDYCRQFDGWNVWKALRVKDATTIAQIPSYDSVDIILLDAYVEGIGGGTGQSFNWDLAIKAKEHGKPIVLAGGLNPKNVAEAVRTVKPYGVDVSSGVEETKGKKDHNKVMEFIKNAKMPSVLYDIVERKKVEVERLRSSGDLSHYLGNIWPASTNFYGAIARQTDWLNLIAEFKITSPSNRRKENPDFRENAVPEEIGKIYAENGAAAISVLTDVVDFKGDLTHLKRMERAMPSIPRLRKDFIIDESQIIESRYFGASAILLIAGILHPDQIRRFIDVAFTYHMDCLVESHNMEDIKKVRYAVERIHNMAARNRVIFGINNRNLHDFSEDLQTTIDLIPEVPNGYPIVAESSIHTPDDIKAFLPYMKEKLDPYGIGGGMLVGTSLMKAPDIGLKVRELLRRE